MVNKFLSKILSFLLFHLVFVSTHYNKVFSLTFDILCWFYCWLKHIFRINTECTWWYSRPMKLRCIGHEVLGVTLSSSIITMRILLPLEKTVVSLFVFFQHELMVFVVNALIKMRFPALLTLSWWKTNGTTRLRLERRS